MQTAGLKIHFSEDSLFVLNCCLAFIMFGVALNIHKSHFSQLLSDKKALFTGLISQILLLPLVTVILVASLRPENSIALGMLLVAACPGGNVSNFFTMLAKGHVALSVTLTAISSSLAFVITPASFFLSSSLFPGLSSEIRSLEISFMDMFLNMVLILLVPLVTGMYFGAKFRLTADRIGKPVRILSMIILAAFIGVAFINNRDAFTSHIHMVIWIVLLHNGLALYVPYLLSRTIGNRESVNRTIAIETGIQNSGLALVLIFTFFGGNAGMALIAAWWGLWHLVSGFTFAMVMRYKSISVNS